MDVGGAKHEGEMQVQEAFVSQMESTQNDGLVRS